MLKRSGHRGFTLIELMITLSILAFLLVLAVPQIGLYTANSRIRAMAQNLANGLQIARNEAVRRNTTAELVLTAVAPVESNVSNAGTGASAINWMVRTVTVDPAGTSTYSFVQGEYGGNGASIDGFRASTTTTLAVVRFDSMSRVSPGAAVFNVTYPTGGTCKDQGGEVSCLRVTVSSSGQVKTCVPGTAATDTRRCLA